MKNPLQPPGETTHQTGTQNRRRRRRPASTAGASRNPTAGDGGEPRPAPRSRITAQPTRSPRRPTAARPAGSPSLGPTMTWRRTWGSWSGPPRGRTGQWSSGPTSWHRFFTGPAQQASQDLPAETARPYPALKQAILAYYGHNLAARAQRFHDWRFDVRGVVQK